MYLVNNIPKKKFDNFEIGRVWERIHLPQDEVLWGNPVHMIISLIKPHKRVEFDYVSN
jgi:hypothetical protein